jgi:hypothetical protein
VSIWYCAEHGLYGGEIACPRCNVIGVIAVMDEDGDMVPDYRDRIEQTERHAWQDMFDELHWEGVVGYVRRT